MFINAFSIYIFLIQCTIFYHKYNSVMALMGPHVRNAEEDEFPAAVSLVRAPQFNRLRVESFHKCTGTLVSRQDVLTAEHCVRDILSEGFKVLIGSSNLFIGAEFFPLFVWTHDQWITFRRRNRTLDEHDIAFVKLTANVNENITFAPTGNIPNENLYGLDLDTAGWGIRADGRRIRVLQTAKIRIMTRFQCQARYLILDHSLVFIHERFLCSIAEPYVVLTSGDSGGPVFFFGILVAVNKGVFPSDNEPNQPHLMNLHMSLRYYREFFDDVITTFHVNF